MGKPIEIRVHGVGGATPEALLNTYATERVSGDESAGYYRSVDASDSDVEAYSWGGLTRRGVAKALWVLLLPFALANTAGWMLAKEGADRPRSDESVLRFLASALFVGSALWVGMVTNLTVTTGCGLVAACDTTRWWLGWLDATALDGGDPVAASRLATLGVVVAPLIWLGVLGWVRRNSDRHVSIVRRARSEDLAYGERHRTSRFWSARPDAALEQTEFWQSSEFEPELAKLQTAAALSAVAGVGFIVLARISQTTTSGTAADWDGGAFAVLYLWLGGVGLVWSILCLIGCGLFPRIFQRGTRPIRAVVGISTVLVAAVAAVGLLGVAPPVSESSMEWLLRFMAKFVNWSKEPASLAEAVSTAGEQSALVFSIAVGVLPLLYLFARGRKVSILGPLVMWMATFLLVAMAAGLTAFMQRIVLGDPLPPGAVPLGTGFDSIGLAFLAGVVTALAARAARRPSSSRHACADPDEEGFDTTEPEYRQWRSSIASASQRSVSFVDGALRALYGFAVGSAVGLGAFFWLGTTTSSTEWWWWSAGASIGRLLLLGWLLAVGWLVRGQWSGDTTTGQLARLWDVVSFWPRWFLPYAPPQYGARAIKDLQMRVQEHLEPAPGGQRPRPSLVLAGHSQGSVLVASTVLALSPDTCKRVGLLTYGSPLSTIYARAFPGFFGAVTLRRIVERLTGEDGVRWRNIFRQTDPIGGFLEDLGSDEVNRCLCDPHQVPLREDDQERLEAMRRDESPAERNDRPVEPDAPPPLGHDEYELTDYYRLNREDLFGMLGG